MQDAEEVAEWGERWLHDWCNEAGLPEDERQTRAWLAEGWRTWTLEIVVSYWVNSPIRVALEDALNHQAANEVALYKGTLYALPVWRLFRLYRSELLPVPEFVLAKFDQWADRLMRLQHAAMADDLPGADEGLAILRALQFVGDRKAHLGLKRQGALKSGGVSPPRFQSCGGYTERHGRRLPSASS